MLVGLGAEAGMNAVRTELLSSIHRKPNEERGEERYREKWWSETT